jgi:hypothetical protein
MKEIFMTWATIHLVFNEQCYTLIYRIFMTCRDRCIVHNRIRTSSWLHSSNNSSIANIVHAQVAIIIITIGFVCDVLHWDIRYDNDD